LNERAYLYFMNSPMPRLPTRTTLHSLSFLSGAFAASKKMESDPSVRHYKPTGPEASFPYTARDLTPMDPGNDTSFYGVPRFVEHIDENAINSVRRYYSQTLPKKGKILDFCSSWISHYPPEVDEARKAGELVILATGMNKSELGQNPVLSAWAVQDLNENPEVDLPTSKGDSSLLDASTCVVSIDYLTKPIEVLKSIRKLTNPGGKIHLAISNRCFPTKVVGRWLKISENERLEMVGDYLWWSGWRDIEIVTLVEATWMKDPLWVVRATNVLG